MTTKLPPQFKKDFSGGMLTNLNETLVPQNSVRLGMNVRFDEELGSVVSRLGTSIVGSQLVSGNSVLGLHDFRDSVGTNHALLATINAAGGATSVVYKVGTGTIRTGLTASKKMRFLTFLDSVLMLNGADAEASYDGATVITTGGAFDLANIPSSNTVSLCREFLDRVYLAGDTANPDRLYYSSTPTAGAISWTSGNGNVDIEREDGGGGITALAKVPNYLLVFKERSLKRFTQVSANPESLVNIGTPSQESVVEAAGLCAFFSGANYARGFYLTDGGRPVPISHDRVKNIKKWVDAIPQASESSIAGYATEREFAWSIGDVTVDGIAYTNVVVRWNRILDQWNVDAYPTQLYVFSPYVNSGVNSIVGGDDNGNVITLNAAATYTDYPSTTRITWRVELHDDDFNYNQLKTISERIVLAGKNLTGAQVEVQPDGKDSVTCGAMTKDVQALPLSRKITCTTTSIAVKGQQSGGQATLKLIEVPNIDVHESY